MYDIVRTYHYLSALLVEVPDESDDAERLCSVLDTIWYGMTPEERSRASLSDKCEDRSQVNQP